MEDAVRRIDAVAGAVGFGLVFVALFLPGPPPTADATAARLVTTLTDHRDAFVRGTVVAGFGVVGLMWFVAALGAALRNADPPDGRAGLAAVVGGGLAVGFMLIGMLLFSGLAFEAAAMGAPAVVRSAVDTGNMAIESS